MTTGNIKILEKISRVKYTKHIRRSVQKPNKFVIILKECKI